MQAEGALALTATALTISETPRAERPLWQVTLAAWLGQRLLIGALVVGWRLELHTLTTAHFLRAFWPFDSVFYFEIAGAGYQTVPQAAYFPLYPLLTHLTAPLVGERYPRANRLMVAPCIARTIILTRLLAGATLAV